MINFFRKTRKKMADDNKPMKYMRYAIGEIVLVVIGILIAIQINNWNEAKKIEILEKKFLESLRSDLVADTIMLSKRIKESEGYKSDYYDFVHQSYEIQNTFEDFLSIQALLEWHSEHLVVRNLTFKELSNSGQLNIFKNNILKDSIASFYLKYETKATHIREYNEYSVKELIKVTSITVRVSGRADYLFDEPKMFKEYDWEFINDPSSIEFNLLQNAVAAYSNKHKTFISFFEFLLKEANSLIDQINKELENRNWN